MNTEGNVTNKSADSYTVAKYGVGFHALTGKDATDCESIEDIDRIIEAATGKKLQVMWYESNLISPRGSVFPTLASFDIDRELDRQLT